MAGNTRRGKGRKGSHSISGGQKKVKKKDENITSTAASQSTTGANKAEKEVTQTEPQIPRRRRRDVDQSGFEALSLNDKCEVKDPSLSSGLRTGPRLFDIIIEQEGGSKKSQLSPDILMPSIEKVSPHNSKTQTKQELSSDGDQTSQMAPDDTVDTFRTYHRRHFFYHDDQPQNLALEWLQKERLTCYYCQIRKFSTNARYPLAITNTVDDQVLPPNFNFIESSILRDGVEAAEKDFRSGCECKDSKNCQLIGCHCLQDIIPTEAEEDGKIFSYHGEGSRAECLRDSKLTSRDPIYECQPECQCSKDCTNRVVERGRKVPLNIFRTSDNRGWGVRSKVNIRKGQFIDKYIGEIITSEEAEKRRQESTKSQRKDVYLFALDKFSDVNSLDPRLSGPAYEVDGEFYSGPTRFINHSCDPNVRIFARVGDHADKHIHDLAFFAVEDIPAQTELTFDYVDGEDAAIKAETLDPKLRSQMTKCLCRTKKCRGYLW